MTRAAVWKQKEQKAEEKHIRGEIRSGIETINDEEQRTEPKDDDCDKKEEDKSEETGWMMMIDNDLFWKS